MAAAAQRTGRTALAGLLAASALVVGPVAAPADAATRSLVVATTGSDAAAGTVTAPLATVRAAVSRLGSSGGTIRLRSGTYHQRFSLHGLRGVTVRPYGSEHVVLSGAGLVPPEGRSAMVDVADSSRVVVRGLEITGYRTSDIDAMPIGLYVHGHGSAVRIEGNHVHDLGNDNGTLGSFDINAHGIAVYGDDPHRSITGLRIDGNTVDHLKLGASETVVVNGNVDGWRIIGNRISSNNNIGIDAIGYEPTLAGKYRYSSLNRARNGVIAHNRVSGIRSQGNPAYYEDGGWCDCADGIYVDGGTRIRITGNRVADNDIGVEVAAENARGNASHVRVDRNTITGSLYTGITTGGYCDGAEDCGGVKTGTSTDNLFDHNVLRGNNRKNDGSPEILVQFFTRHDRFLHNRVTATNDAHVVLGTVDRDRSGAGNTSDRNRFSAVGAPASKAVFGWRGKTYTGFGSYRKATGQDRHSTYR